MRRGYLLPLLTALLATSVPAIAVAQIDEPIFALPFGKKLDRSFPECGSRYEPRNDYCSNYRLITPDVVSKQLTLQRPSFATNLKIPQWINIEGFVQAEVDQDGVLDSIAVTTRGPSYQANIIAAITERFGPATTSETREASNALGAKWSVTKAEWNLPDARIYFNCFSIKECFLTIRTPAAQARFTARAAQNKQRDKM